MAERRMFAKTIVTSDEFLDMPATARNSPKSVMRQVGASNDDMNILIAKKYVLMFDGGVLVIKHWKVHNYIQKDRYNETKYLDFKRMLYLDENKAYTTNEQSAKYTVYGELIDHSQDNVYILDTQDSIGKDRLELNIANPRDNCPF